MKVAAIIAAGGVGSRLGVGTPKQLLPIGDRSMLERTLDAFDACAVVERIIIALPAALADNPPAFLLTRVKPTEVVAGGARRQDSVANGFAALPEHFDLIVVHDAARPFVTADLIARTIESAARWGASIAAIGVSDTVKHVSGTDGEMLVSSTIPREHIALAQTPQAFRRDVLRDAIRMGQSGIHGTDEAALAEAAGHRVAIVQGDPANVKITTASDLAAARTSVVDRRGGGLRIGAGYDLHRLVEGRRLVLGGVEVPFEKGLAGHSDADVVCHAVIDAILGAAAAGDIGRHFPDTDPCWKNASSLDLLARASEVVKAAGYRVDNVDVVIIAERPKLAYHVDAMRAALATAVGIDPEQVGVKGKTNEGVGELGRGEAIAAHAVALISRR